MSFPGGRLVLWGHHTAILAAIHQAMASSASGPRPLPPLVVLFVGCRSIPGQLIPMRNQEVLDTVHNAQVSSDHRGGRVHTEDTTEHVCEMPGFSPQSAPHLLPSP